MAEDGGSASPDTAMRESDPPAVASPDRQVAEMGIAAGQAAGNIHLQARHGGKLCLVVPAAKHFQVP